MSKSWVSPSRRRSSARSADVREETNSGRVRMLRRMQALRNLNGCIKGDEERVLEPVGWAEDC